MDWELLADFVEGRVAVRLPKTYRVEVTYLKVHSRIGGVPGLLRQLNRRVATLIAQGYYMWCVRGDISDPRKHIGIPTDASIVQ